MTTTTDSLANVPHPVGAVHVADWDGVQFGIEHTGRYFHGSVRVVERDGDNEDDISVEIYGSQGAAGDVTRLIAIDEGEHERIHLSSPTHAREFARALIAAADEVEQMAGYDPTT
jgi:hypothetical protein